MWLVIGITCSLVLLVLAVGAHCKYREESAAHQVTKDKLKAAEREHVYQGMAMLRIGQALVMEAQDSSKGRT